MTGQIWRAATFGTDEEYSAALRVDAAGLVIPHILELQGVVNGCVSCYYSWLGTLLIWSVGSFSHGVARNVFV